ncbi:MAG: MBL fold metallo-hydrolase [Chloroflexi bacterium]|nr:MBL fold metallo-hydrolase [Chloroflexota bacterium]
MQVADGVFQFKVPMPSMRGVADGRLRYTLVYAVRTDEGWVVIDAGWNTDEGFGAFQRYLSEAGIAPEDVSAIVLTHGHPDHSGLAGRIKELTGARLAMHRLDADGGDLGRMQALFRDPEAAHRWMARYGVPPEELPQDAWPRPAGRSQGPPPPQRSFALEVDVVLDGGEEIVAGSGLWAIWTPGHSPGHVCVHDQKRKLLFSGDHVLPVVTPFVRLYPGDEGDPLAGFLQAQRDLKKLDVEMVHPAHEHSFPDLRRRVDEILRHHRERFDEILAQVHDGPKTAWQIASSIRWNVGPWRELGSWTRRMALLETLAHIQHMVMEGELASLDTGLTVRYSPAQP